MRTIVLVLGLVLGLVLAAGGTAVAQAPAGGSAVTPPAAAAPVAAPVPAGDPAAAPPGAPADPAAAAIPVPAPASPSDLRKTCVAAMNADPTFAKAIVETADKQAAEARLKLDLQQHQLAALAIAKNERHVIIAYMAMWLVAVGFVLFLWRRQQRLNLEIGQLRRDLEAAGKDGK